MDQPLLFDESLRKIEFLFRYAGINIKSGEKKSTDALKSRFIYVVNFVWLNTDVAGAIWWLLVGLAAGTSLTELTYIAPCVMLSSLSDFKSLFLIINEKEVEQLIGNLREMEIKENTREKNKIKTEIIREETKFLNIVINVLNVLNVSLLVTFALNPLALMGIKYLKTNEVEFLLPFLIIYPFDPYDIRYWPIVYLRQIWSEIVAVLGISAGDYLFYTFCTYVRLQFRLLQHNVEKIIKPINHSNEVIVYDHELHAKFVEIIQWHQDLIKSTKILEKIYTRSTLYNFITSSVIICLTGFNVTAINDVALILTFLSFLFMSLLQIFFLCFFGDLLMTSSMEVGDAAYNAKWYLADVQIAKDLLLVQTRAQKPCTLSASGFAEVNLNAFTKVLSTAWSYFALLQTLNSTPNE